MPYWLAREFHNSNELLEIELPKHYGRRMRDEIEAGAGKIRFRDFSYYYFEMGRDLAKSTLQDDDLLEKLRKAYAGPRYRALTARALTAPPSGGALCRRSPRTRLPL